MREYERRKAKDEARVQVQIDQVQARFGHGLVGKAVTSLTVDASPRQSTAVWKQGAIGEERVAEQLECLSRHGIVSLHDRRIPGTSANIDHIVVTPWSVWVIDAKRYLGKRPTRYLSGGIFGIGATAGLMVGGRKKDNLVEGVLKQCARVQQALGEGTPQVKGLLCFVDADWPMIGGDFTVQGVRVCWPKRLKKELVRSTPASIGVETITHLLTARFPSHSG